MNSIFKNKTQNSNKFDKMSCYAISAKTSATTKRNYRTFVAYWGLIYPLSIGKAHELVDSMADHFVHSLTLGRLGWVRL